MAANIDWSCPDPRSGWKGAIDRLIGPGATPVEVRFQFGLAFLAAAVLLASVWLRALDWSVWKIIVGAFLAFDMVGGVMTNATSPAKRWFHREGRTFKQHLSFIVEHFLHLALVATIFRHFDYVYFGITYGYLVAASVMILKSPLYMQRPVALLLYLGALLIGQYTVSPTPGLEWFLPFYYLKLLVAYCVREEPYRPDVVLPGEPRTE